MQFYHDFIETPLGWMGLLVSAYGIRQTTLPQTSPQECMDLLSDTLIDSTWSPMRCEKIKTKLSLYFNGRSVTFNEEEIDFNNASQFAQTTWNICMTIPFGETRSYSWLAERVGKPRAPRAIGQCMAKNRLAIIVPCHRVISSDGSLGGFGANGTQLPLKQALLDLERINSKQIHPYSEQFL